MNLYYAGPAEITGPILDRVGGGENLPDWLLFEEPELRAESIMWNCPRHHLLEGASVLFCNPRRRLAALRNRLDQAMAPVPQIGLSLEDLAAEVFDFVSAATHPSHKASSALFLNDLPLLLGAKDRRRSLACSLATYIGYAQAVGAACYVTCKYPETLGAGLRRALESFATATIRLRPAEAALAYSPARNQATYVGAGARRSA